MTVPGSVMPAVMISVRSTSAVVAWLYARLQSVPGVMVSVPRPGTSMVLAGVSGP
jgi:hypothetical protein